MAFRAFLMKLLLVAALVGVASARVVSLNVTALDYTDPYDNDFPLRGYLSLPGKLPAPAVVIIVSFERDIPRPHDI